MINQKRKCSIFYDGKRIECFFEMYGTIQEFNESGDSFPITVAILEKSDGTVITVCPNKSEIKFIDL